MHEQEPQLPENLQPRVSVHPHKSQNECAAVPANHTTDQSFGIGPRLFTRQKSDVDKRRGLRFERGKILGQRSLEEQSETREDSETQHLKGTGQWRENRCELVE